MHANLQLPYISGGSKTTQVELDGVDVSTALVGLTLTAGINQGTTLELELAITEITTFNGECDVLIPESTRDLLVHLGWTPPSTQHDQQTTT